MVRKVTIQDATIGDWAAVTDLMHQQMLDGTFNDTIVVISWDEETPSIALGPQEDAVQLDRAAVDDDDVVFGRNLWSGGGTGLFVPEIPLVLVYYENDRYSSDKETLRYHFDDVNGRANTRALERLGLDAEYDPIGDTEVVVDGTRYKVMSGSACNFEAPQYWAVVSSVIWEPLPDKAGMMYNSVTKPPKEKFEDKDTESLTGRMRSISELLDDVETSASKEDAIDAFVEENAKQVFGPDTTVVDENWHPEEAAYIDRIASYFESESWINRFSTRRLCRRADPHDKIGVAAYKSRKLVKASIVVNDEGYIDDAIFTGDFFMRPVLPTTSRSVIDELSTAICGLDPVDEAALKDTLNTVLARTDIEIPMVDAGDFVAPVVRAGTNTQPIETYLDESPETTE